MCPGGFVVPAASGAEQIVVNGMSPSNRGSRWANSGMVVEIRPDDFPEYGKHGVLAMIRVTKKIRTAMFSKRKPTTNSSRRNVWWIL